MAIKTLSCHELLELAEDSYRKENLVTSLKYLSYLLEGGRSACDASAYMLRGLIYEYGGEQVEVNFPLALSNYKNASALIRGEVSAPHLYIARVLMKMKKIDEARSSLEAAKNICNSPEVELAYAYFYQNCIRDVALCKSHYKRAAFRGRYAGFFGWSRLLKSEGKVVAAFFVDAVRIAMAPLLIALFGRSVMNSFDGY